MATIINYINSYECVILVSGILLIATIALIVALPIILLVATKE